MTDDDDDRAGHFDWVTDKMFEDGLEHLVEEDGVTVLMDIPGVHEIVRKHHNNDVLEHIKEKHPELWLKSQWDTFVEKWKDKLLKPQIELDDWFVLELDNDEMVIYPASLFTEQGVFDLHQDAIKQEDIERVTQQYGARLSAPGYLDCTQWDLFETEEDAMNSLMEEFDDE